MFLLVFGIYWVLIREISWFGLLMEIRYMLSLLINRCYLLILGGILFMNKFGTRFVGVGTIS